MRAVLPFMEAADLLVPSLLALSATGSAEYHFGGFLIWNSGFGFTTADSGRPHVLHVNSKVDKQSFSLHISSISISSLQYGHVAVKLILL